MIYEAIEGRTRYPLGADPQNVVRHLQDIGPYRVRHAKIEAVEFFEGRRCHHQKPAEQWLREHGALSPVVRYRTVSIASLCEQPHVSADSVTRFLAVRPKGALDKLEVQELDGHGRVLNVTAATEWLAADPDKWWTKRKYRIDEKGVAVRVTCEAQDVVTELKHVSPQRRLKGITVTTIYPVDEREETLPAEQWLQKHNQPTGRPEMKITETHHCIQVENDEGVHMDISIGMEVNNGEMSIGTYAFPVEAWPTIKRLASQLYAQLPQAEAPMQPGSYRSTGSPASAVPPPL